MCCISFSFNHNMKYLKALQIICKASMIGKVHQGHHLRTIVDRGQPDPTSARTAAFGNFSYTYLKCLTMNNVTSDPLMGEASLACLKSAHQELSNVV